MFEFQTLMTQLTGQEVSGVAGGMASTATTEAILMAERVTGRHRIIMAKTLHPEYREIAKTYTQNQADVELVEVGYESTGQIDVAALESRARSADRRQIVIQSPNFFGVIEKTKQIAEIVHRHGALLIVSINEPLSLAVVRPPVEADIVCGEAQSCGVSNGVSVGLTWASSPRRKKIYTPDAEAAGWTNRRHRRPQGDFVLTLCDPRAAHSSREGDVKHLHESIVVCTHGDHLSDASGKERTAKRSPSRISPRPITPLPRFAESKDFRCRSGARTSTNSWSRSGQCRALTKNCGEDKIVGGLNSTKDYSTRRQSAARLLHGTCQPRAQVESVRRGLQAVCGFVAACFAPV